MNIYPVSNEVDMRIYDKETLEKILGFEYDFVILHDKCIEVCTDGKFGCFSYEGKCITGDRLWDKTLVLRDGIIVVKNKLQGFFDFDGKQIFKCEHKRIECHFKAIVTFKGRKTLIYELKRE